MISRTAAFAKRTSFPRIKETIAAVSLFLLVVLVLWRWAKKEDYLLEPMYRTPGARVMLATLASVCGLAVISRHEASRLTSLRTAAGPLSSVAVMFLVCFTVAHIVSPLILLNPTTRLGLLFTFAITQEENASSPLNSGVRFLDPSLPLLFCGIFLFFPSIQAVPYGRLARLLLDIFLSPFSQVTLSHVLVADFLTSLASPLRDLAICSCYLYRSLVDAEQVGISVAQNSCETLPLVALIPLVPALIRLLQCCRQIVLTHSVFPVINAIKYASVFPLVIFPLMEGFGALEAHELSPLFVARLANTSLSLVWDLTMDWGVFSSQSFLLDMDVAEEQVKRLPSYSYKNSQRRSTWPCLKFLRASSVFQPQSIIALIIVDFALRSFWVLGLLSLSLPAGLLLVLAQVLEIFRRLLWLLLKVEWEAVRSLPLTDRDEEEVDGNSSDSATAINQEREIERLVTARNKSSGIKNFVEGAAMLRDKRAGRRVDL